MSTVSIADFLAENVAPVEETKEVKFKRFKAPFTIKSLTGEDVNRLRREATKRVTNRKTHQVEDQLDQNEFVNKVLVASVVEPDLLNEKLQRSYGVIGDPAKLLGTMLTAGEYNALSQEIMDLSRIGDDEADLIENAKN